MRIPVIGGGSWGTTLANLLAKKGHDVTLWLREPDLLHEILTKRENSWYLPGIPLDPSLKASLQLEEALEGGECFLLGVPSQHMRSMLEVARSYLPKKPVMVCASKGIEVSTLSTMSMVVNEALSGLKPQFCMLSGPTFAKEVIRELPTAIVLATDEKKLGRELQQQLSTDFFRVYTSTDVRGVELGGAIKNIIAIAAGIADGLGFGNNSRAALITRGLAEMSRLGKALGAKSGTFMGLAGMGDLVLTCTGDLSRNRQVGLKLGKGHKLVEILGEMKMVAEGVKTTEAVHALGKKHDVELPITEQVYQVLYNGKDPRTAVHELMLRDLKEE